jgi:Rrf2 family nitric oxide-sensitive transcriptional repressor
MHLTTYSDYAMRVLMYLGLQKDQLVTIAQVAERYAISENHLTKVVHFLGQQGYIETVRGKGGGLRLKLLPAEINLGKVLQLTEGDEGLLPCVNGASDCCILPACRLVRILRESQSALYQVLGKYTLADLLTDNAPLDALLSEEL